MKTALVIPHYHATRKENVDKIIRGVKNWSRKPDRIIVFNNNPDYVFSSSVRKTGDPDFTVINSDENFGSIARYGIALISRCDQFVFQDDDLILGNEAFESLLNSLELHPRSVIGMIGGNWQPGKTYAEKRSIEVVSDVDVPVDFVLGRVSCAHRAIVARCFHFIEAFDEMVGGIQAPSWCHEDIAMSFTVTKAGRRNYLVKRDFKELPSGGVGLEHHPDHYNIRDRLTQAFLNNGMVKV